MSARAGRPGGVVPGPAPGRARLVWVDVARGLALVSMFVAHTNPSAGPGGLFNLTEFLTAALFAGLVGVSARLEAERHGPGRAFVRAVVRAAFLALFGWVTVFFGAQVEDILTHLAVITVAMSALALLPRVVHAALAVASAAAGVWLSGMGSTALALRLMDLAAPLGRLPEPLGPLLRLDPTAAHLGASRFFTDGSYRLPFLLGWALLAVLLLRSVRDRGALGGGRRGRLTAALWGAAGLALAMASLVWARAQTGENPVAYAGTAESFAFSAGLVLTVLGLCAACVPDDVPWLTAPLAVAGSMTLSVYVAHQAYLGWAVGGWPAAPEALRAGAGPWLTSAGTDDTWFNTAVLTLGGLLLPLLWRAVVRAEPWRRGPLEAPVALATRPLSR